MASGVGKRFGSNKLMENLNSKPLIKWIIDTTDNLFDRRIVVTRSSEVNELCKNINVQCILHEMPNRNDTVRLGLSELMNDIDYCFFATGDQPLIKRESITKLKEEALTNNERIVRASFGNVVASPMGFPASFFNELLNLPEGKGGNFIANNNPDMISTVTVQNEYELYDVDTVADLEIIKNLLKTEI